MIVQRVAVVLDRGSYIYCRRAIGGAYYYPVARMSERDQAKELVKGSQDEMIIVRFSDRRWVVTTKSADEDDIKSIRAECSNRIDAEGMIR